MSDKVRPQDLAKYLKEYFLPRWQERASRSLQVYEQNKKEYENTWWSKLFGCKYENSYEVEYGYWDYKEYEYIVVCTEIIVDRITYQIKTSQEFMDFPSNLPINSFYTWCADNSIPY